VPLAVYIIHSSLSKRDALDDAVRGSALLIISTLSNAEGIDGQGFFALYFSL
jgi:hypothetical protein